MHQSPFHWAHPAPTGRNRHPDSLGRRGSWISPQDLGIISQPISTTIPTATRRRSTIIDESLELGVSAHAPEDSQGLFDSFEEANGGEALESEEPTEFQIAALPAVLRSKKAPIHQG